MTGGLRVTIVSAEGLRTAEWLHSRPHHPYCVCEIPSKPSSRVRTKTCPGTLEPVWDHADIIPDFALGDSLKFTVWDEGAGRQDDVLGTATLPGTRFYPSGFRGDLKLAEAGGSKATLRIEIAPPQGTITGLGIRRRLWAAVGSTDPDSWTGFGVRRRARRKAALALIDMSEGLRRKMMDGTRETIKDAVTADPDMCYCLDRFLRQCVDILWTDVEIEVAVAVDEVKLGVEGHTMGEVRSLGEVGERPCVGSPAWFRAFVLYHFLPYDVSMIGQFKDPVFWVLLVLSILPIVRVVFYLLLLIFFAVKPPLDEFQLVQYIMMFKGLQFLSSGLAMAGYGAVLYYLCIQDDGTHTCGAEGPGTQTPAWVQAADIAGSCVLVWVGFLLLPYSQKCAGLKAPSDDSDHDEETADELDGQDGRCCRCSRDTTRGGRLKQMLRYDLACFVLSCILLLALLAQSCRSCPGSPGHIRVLSWELWLHTGSWQWRTRVFWARTAYSLMALPFTVLYLFLPLLTHTRATGFNRNGAVVAYLLPPVGKRSAPSPGAPHGGEESVPLRCSAADACW